MVLAAEGLEGETFADPLRGALVDRHPVHAVPVLSAPLRLHVLPSDQNSNTTYTRAW